MRSLIALLFLSLQLSNSFAETTSRTDAAKEFAYCFVYYLLTSQAAPESDRQLGARSQSEAFKRRAEAYGQISIMLSQPFNAGGINITFCF